MMHYGRRRPHCQATRAVAGSPPTPGSLTLTRKKVTCPACRLELSGADMLRAFRRDLDGAL